MKCSTDNVMGEHHYSFYVVVSTHAFNAHKLKVSVVPLT